MTATYKKLFSYLFKSAIVIFAFWFIYTKLSGNNDLKEFMLLMEHLPEQEIVFILGTVLLLMLVNWGIEAVKWKHLIRTVESLSLWRAIESVFCGLTWAIFTPNRLGEYGGRVFFLSPKRRIIGVIAMAVGNIGQLVLTNVFGSIAICLFVYRFQLLDGVLFMALAALATFFSLFFLVFFFNIRWLNSLLLAVKWTRQYQRFYKVLARYRKRELSHILLLCFARYAVFTAQYYIMFSWLIPELYTTDILMMVCILFLVQSSLPSLDLFDIGIRSVTGLFFFKYITDQNSAVVACIASIWLINIIIPAILGSYFVFKLNFFGNTQRTGTH